MEIRILRLLEGAKKARGIAVIIDVFRAFSFECYAIHNNVERIIPVASKELAYELKRKNPDYIVAGERKGIMLPGFDYGNSPSQIEHVDLTGKTLVHTTSAGTQGLEGAVIAEEIITGSFVNAKAIASYIKEKRHKEVSLVCMGAEAIARSEEDDLCAKYIEALLRDEKRDFTAEIENLRYTSGKKFFDESRKEVFPERDFHLCTKTDIFDFVLKFVYEDGIGQILPIEVIN